MQEMAEFFALIGVMWQTFQGAFWIECWFCGALSAAIVAENKNMPYAVWFLITLIIPPMIFPLLALKTKPPKAARHIGTITNWPPPL